MKYVIYAVNESMDHILLGVATTDEEAKDIIAEQLRQAPAANVQACMLN